MRMWGERSCKCGPGGGTVGQIAALRAGNPLSQKASVISCVYRRQTEWGGDLVIGPLRCAADLLIYKNVALSPTIILRWYTYIQAMEDLDRAMTDAERKARYGGPLGYGTYDINRIAQHAINFVRGNANNIKRGI